MYLAAPIFLIPFFGWGLFALHRKYRRREEWPAWVEALTILALALFYAVEIDELKVWLQHQRIAYYFSVMGLFVAGLALYGHMVVSLLSRAIVEAVSPGDEAAADRPRFGPAEILEHQGDWEGALQEYLILLRIFPRHPAVNQRAGECCIALHRPEEAAKWLVRAVRHHPPDEKILPLLSRACEVYDRMLRQPDNARKVLDDFLAAYPGYSQAEAVVLRRHQIGAAAPLEKPHALDALAETPIANGESSEDAPAKRTRRQKKHRHPDSLLTPMAAPDVSAAPDKSMDSLQECGALHLDIAPMDEAIAAPDAPQPEEAQRVPEALPGLLAMDTAETLPQEDETLEPPPHKPEDVSLDPM